MAGAANVEIIKTNDFIEIRISDQGPGIPADQIDQAIDPFKRLSDARESNRGGFGLGLPIVKAIVQGHDGEFDLAANNPHGLIATIKLPG